MTDSPKDIDGRTYINRQQMNTFLFNNPVAGAVIAKTVRKATTQRRTIKQVENYATEKMEQAYDNQAVQGEFGKMFYDLEIAVDIMVGLILSPKGSVRPELVYGVDNDNLPTSITGHILDQIARYMNKQYRLSVHLSKLLKKVMYSHGSVVRIIIPENIVDKVIAGSIMPSQESLGCMYRADGRIPLLGYLGNPTEKRPLSLGAELYHSVDKPTSAVSYDLREFNITITDNVNIMKEPRLRESITQKGVENIAYNSDLQSKWHGAIDLDNVMPDRESIGPPLYMEVDSGAVIPIHIPGDPTKHVSYIVPLDERGYIISPRDVKEALQDIEANSNFVPMGKSLLDTAKQNLRKFKNNNTVNPEIVIDLFIERVENTIKKMASAGSYHTQLEFSKVNSVYVTMLARALDGLQTRLLFIPENMVAYYALRYDRSGCGVTLLHDLPTLSSMRAALLFSGLISEVRNNIPQTKVNVKLDEQDTDPEGSLEIIEGNALARQAKYIATGLVNTTDWIDWSQRAGLSFQIEEHPMLPNTQITYEDTSSQRMVPGDSEFADKLRSQQIMAIGVTPEMVDNGFASDFASTDAAKRIQLARRVTSDQIVVSDQITSEVRKIARADGNVQKIIRDGLMRIGDISTYLTDEYLSVWKKDKELLYDQLTHEISVSLKVDLPAPDTDNLSTILDNIRNYQAVLDTAMESWINSDFITGTEDGEVLNENVDKIRNAVRAYYMRSYMLKNGYLTELSKMVGIKEKGNPTLDLQEEMRGHIQGLATMADGYIKELNKFVSKSEDTLPTEEEPADTAGGEDDLLDDTADDTTDTGDDKGEGDGLDLIDDI